jgi:NAD(P)-dependent dehydrogenase (short-subunit alcohol dehydrogenase family)
MSNGKTTRRTVLGGALAAGLGTVPIAQAAAAERSAGRPHPDRKVVLITGTSSGFGWLTALTLARAGHHVFASMRNTWTSNAGAAKRLRRIADDERLALEVIDIDVRNDWSVEHGVRQVVRRAGRIDVLVNNAGVFYPALLETLTIDDIREVFETNVFGHLRMNRAVLPTMREQGSGLVVQLTTALGRFVFPFMGSYVGSKWAMEAMTEVSRYELRKLGVDVVIVEPGAYNTDLVDPNGVAYYRRYLRELSSEDAGRREEYGELARRVEVHLVEEPDLPDSQEIADAIAGLVRTPSEQRPVRLLGPGVDGLIGELTEVHAQLQRDVMEGSGFGDLL